MQKHPLEMFPAFIFRKSKFLKPLQSAVETLFKNANQNFWAMAKRKEKHGITIKNEDGTVETDKKIAAN